MHDLNSKLFKKKKIISKIKKKEKNLKANFIGLKLQRTIKIILKIINEKI